MIQQFVSTCRASYQGIAAELGEAQGQLLTIKQRHADLFAKLELTRHEHEREQQKEKVTYPIQIVTLQK